MLGAIAPDAGTVEVLGVFAGLDGVSEPEAAVVAGLERFRIAHLAEATASERSSGQRTAADTTPEDFAKAAPADPSRENARVTVFPERSALTFQTSPSRLLLASARPREGRRPRRR